MESSLSSSQRENLLKKKLQIFQWDLAHFGSVQGFKHFTCYLRGKEELLVSVKNRIKGSSVVSGSLLAPAPKKPLCATDSLNSSNLPYDKSSLVLSLQSQALLRNRQGRDADLLPASPSEEETHLEAESTLFLVAGYDRYMYPYVWVRSNHDRLFKISGDSDDDKNSPLRLKSTFKWKDEDIKVFDIVSELVKLCTYPAPRNPFEVDQDYFNFLKQPDQFLASAAMMNMLQQILVHSSKSKVYIAKVFEELQLVSRIHFKSSRDLCLNGNLEILPAKRAPAHQSTQYQSRKSNQDYPVKQSSGTSSTSSSSNTDVQTAQYLGASGTQARPILMPTVTSSVPANQFFNSFQVTQTTPTYNSATVYGRRPKGAFPGGYDKMPAPSLL